MCQVSSICSTLKLPYKLQLTLIFLQPLHNSPYITYSYTALALPFVGHEIVSVKSLRILLDAVSQSSRFLPWRIMLRIFVSLLFRSSVLPSGKAW